MTRKTDEIATLKAQLEEARKPKDTTYNGWRNYETWLVNLWGDNEQYIQEMFNESAKRHIRRNTDCDTGFFDEPEAITDLATEIEGAWCDGDIIPDMPTTGLLSDICNTFFQDVDWEEIASHYIADNK